MAFFENRFYMAGRVSSDIKFAKTVNGENYVWFALSIENKLAHNSTENNKFQDIGIMVFTKNLIDYIKRVNLKRNDLCVVFGWVSAFRHQVKGKDITGHGINATQVFAVKTKAED